MNGSLRISVGPGIDERTFDRHITPKDKGLIEADIAEEFARLVSKDDADVAHMTQLPENDLGFGWMQNGRKAKLALDTSTFVAPYARDIRGNDDGQSER